MNSTSTQIRLAAYPDGEPRDSDFDVVTTPLPSLADGQVLLRTIYLSLDPYMRGRMSPAKSYAPPLQPGDVVLGGTVCEVLDSRSKRYSAGDVVLATTGWQTHAVVDTSRLRLLDPDEAPISTALGVLGMPGFTAYAGLLEIGRPQPGETVVVAAATGPVGSAVGQIARLKGARAVGIAGGVEKCGILTEEFGFDAALDHRSPTFAEDLAAVTPHGIDLYFENVGGHVTEVVRHRLNDHARIPVCGLVADYNDTQLVSEIDRLPGFMRQVLTQRLTVRGFTQNDFVDTPYREDFRRDMTEWVLANSVRYREDITDGLDRAVETFRGMLAGRNLGKVLIRVSEEPSAARRPA